jgi:hypothetical protein
MLSQSHDSTFIDDRNMPQIESKDVRNRNPRGSQNQNSQYPNRDERSINESLSSINGKVKSPKFTPTNVQEPKMPVSKGRNRHQMMSNQIQKESIESECDRRDTQDCSENGMPDQKDNQREKDTDPIRPFLTYFMCLNQMFVPRSQSNKHDKSYCDVLKAKKESAIKAEDYYLVFSRYYWRCNLNIRKRTFNPSEIEEVQKSDFQNGFDGSSLPEVDKIDECDDWSKLNIDGLYSIRDKLYSRVNKSRKDHIKACQAYIYHQIQSNSINVGFPDRVREPSKEIELIFSLELEYFTKSSRFSTLLPNPIWPRVSPLAGEDGKPQPFTREILVAYAGTLMADLYLLLRAQDEFILKEQEKHEQQELDSTAASAHGFTKVNVSSMQLHGLAIDNSQEIQNIDEFKKSCLDIISLVDLAITSVPHLKDRLVTAFYKLDNTKKLVWMEHFLEAIERLILIRIRFNMCCSFGKVRSKATDTLIPIFLRYNPFCRYS